MNTQRRHAKSKRLDFYTRYKGHGAELASLLDSQAITMRLYGVNGQEQDSERTVVRCMHAGTTVEDTSTTSLYQNG